MALFGPAIPTAILLSPEGQQEVYPATEHWWQNIITLRTASQQDRLRCPDCGQRLVFVCEGVPTPHFKHYRDTDGCLVRLEHDEARKAGKSSAWLRHQLVVGLRQALPAGTTVDCGQYLAGRTSDMTIRLPDATAFVLDVISQPPDLKAYAEKEAASPLPIQRIFVGRRVPAAVRGPAGVIHIGGGLNADHLQAALPLRVDSAHAARHAFYNLRAVADQPQSLLFYLPGRTYRQAGTLAILRGMLPDPDQTRWHGTLIKLPLDGASRLRYSRRHGFFIDDDIAVLKHYRQRLRGQRVAQAEFPAAHPVDRLWLRQRAALAEARRREQARAGAERHAAEEAAEAQRRYGVLMSVLRGEGLALLNNSPLPIPYPDRYTVQPLEWQARLVGFVHRAGVSFTLEAAVGWLRNRRYTRGYSVECELANMQAFWQGAARLGLVRLEPKDDLVIPLRRHAWPVRSPATASEPALCIMCATIALDPDLSLTRQWHLFDPATGLCICTDCPSE
ncbi:MAG: hypothetical protein K0R39_2710 [Symbiobacteriaceae bacterium]|jgi:hypothetical protein|nr:hypothetical protein [Symbiobacteriaceae bacterium]